MFPLDDEIMSGDDLSDMRHQVITRNEVYLFQMGVRTNFM